MLSKDVAEYLAASAYPGEEAFIFNQMYRRALNMERDFWKKHGPSLYLTLEQAGLPNGFARAAAGGNPDMRTLDDSRILHEWIKHPGWDLLNTYAKEYKEAICGKEGPYEKLNKGLITHDDIPIAIARRILTVGFFSDPFWYPLVVCIAHLLSKVALKPFCETGQVLLNQQ